MPLYEYECSRCGLIGEQYFKRIVGIPQSKPCKCGGIANKIISLCGISIDNESYNPAFGKVMTKKAAKEEALKIGANQL